jgi:hypothetical protein
MENHGMFEQNNITLPHDVIKLPSKGIFYKPKKESLKVGYLTAADENLLMTQNAPKDGLITTLLKNKIYEPGFNVNQLLDADAKAILIFLRNTSFGPEYTFDLVDPKTNRPFEAQLMLDELDFKKLEIQPDDNGYFDYVLPKSQKKVKLKLLSLSDMTEIDNLKNNYPVNVVAPIVTKTLEKHIVEIDGVTDKQEISKFITQMPISDSKSLRKFLKECEPGIDLKKTVTAPSGEKVTFEVSFGVEFFLPFFSV